MHLPANPQVNQLEILLLNLQINLLESLLVNQPAILHALLLTNHPAHPVAHLESQQAYLRVHRSENLQTFQRAFLLMHPLVSRQTIHRYDPFLLLVGQVAIQALTPRYDQLDIRRVILVVYPVKFQLASLLTIHQVNHLNSQSDSLLDNLQDPPRAIQRRALLENQQGNHVDIHLVTLQAQLANLLGNRLENHLMNRRVALLLIQSTPPCAISLLPLPSKLN